MTSWSDFHAVGTPGSRLLPASFKGAKRVIGRQNAGGGEGQQCRCGARQSLRRRIQNWLAPTVHVSREISAVHIGRRHQQGRRHTMHVARHCGPRRHQMATQAVRHQADGLAGVLGQDHIFKPGDPVTPQGALPVVLLYPLVPMRALPQSLPMQRPGVEPAGQNQGDVRFQFAIKFIAASACCIRIVAIIYGNLRSKSAFFAV